jgi:hypothetical protein
VVSSPKYIAKMAPYREPVVVQQPEERWVTFIQLLVDHFPDTTRKAELLTVVSEITISRKHKGVLDKIMGWIR